jgi:hypothetical protein
MLAQVYPRIIDRIGEWNPQLFREAQGRLQLRNIALVSGFSLIGQIFLYLYFQGILPLSEGIYSRYCTSLSDSAVNDYYGGSQKCITDLLGNIQIIKELWWLDIFTTMSVMGIFITLVVGCYMLIADLTKEERQGTFNFIRLSPQSAFSILAGKMLGVPILVYLFGILAIPFHLKAGLSAHIPLHLIFGFYLVLVASCFFFYSASMLYSLVTNNLGNFQPLLGGGMVLFFLLVIMAVTHDSHGLEYSETSFDWLLFFYPGTYLIYLVKSTFLAPDTVGYLVSPALMNLNWYGQFFWRNSASAFAFIIFNYGLWSFWLWQGLKRRFHNPRTTVITKYHSYWLSACFIVFSLGFALQSSDYYNSYNSYHSLEQSLIVVQVFNFILFLILIAALSPHRQSLQDWARFRHQKSLEKRNIWRDLLLGEKSPAVLAIALNILIVNFYLLPAVLMFPFPKSKLSIMMGLLFGGAVILVYASIAQLLVMLKTDKRGLIASGTISALIIVPFASAAMFPQIANMQVIRLFSAFPLLVNNYISTLELIGVGLCYLVSLSFFNWQMKRLLDKAGMSETKMLLAEK